MRRIRVTTVLLLVLFACINTQAFSADTFKIGMITTLSGPFEFVGRTYVAGMEFAVEEQNAKGGILGKKIELIIEDDEFKPDIAIRKARSLISEKNINLLDGAGGSHVAIALNKVATATKTLTINHTASADAITGKEFSRYAFRVIFNSHNITAALVHAMVGKPYRKFYIINQDYALGRESARAFKELLKSRIPDAQIVGEDYHPPATKDFGPYVNKILAAKADAIFTTNYGPDFTNLVRQARTLGLNKDVPLLTLYGGEPYVLNQLKDEAVGLYHAQMYSMNVKTPENQALIAKYHERHKTDKDFLTWWPYPQIGQTILGFRMVFAAIEKAGSFDTEKIIKTLEGFRYESAVGSWYMRPCDHQVILPMYVGIVEGGQNPYFNGSIRPDVSFPWEGPNLIMIPADQVALPATADYNPRCK